MRFLEWWARPANRWAMAGLLALAYLIPVWLLLDAIDLVWLKFPSLLLRADDFEYLAHSHNWSRTVENLWVPHNSHVVPFFRLWSWLVFRAAGGWEHLPNAAAFASYAVLVSLMHLTWRFLRRETGHDLVALCAVIGLGVSTVTHPAVTWFAASQTLWAGLGVLGTLCALQGWRKRGGVGRLCLAGAAACVAVGSWSGGFVVGPVAAAYLWVGGNRSCRKAALGIIVVTLLLGTALVFWKGRELVAKKNLGERSPSDAIQPIAGILHTVHAIPEFLVLRNMGLDTSTTTSQAAVFLVVIILARTCTRHAAPITALECAGGVMIVSSLFLVYSVRGYLPFESVRELRWYCTLPQIGTALFVSGWCSGLLSRLRPEVTLTRRGVLCVLAFMAGIATLHLAASHEMFVRAAPRLAPSEIEWVPTPELRLIRARGLWAGQIDRQRRFLARLDGIERIAQRSNIGRQLITIVFGSLEGPGVPKSTDAIDMLLIPAEGSQKDVSFIRRMLGEYMLDEPEPRPPWLAPDDPWPPSSD